MKKIFFLGTCSTCKRVIHDLKPGSDFEMREIKSAPITPEELDHLRSITGSYESLFSRIAMKYRALGLDKVKLTEEDFRRYILEEYTFLKRPVVLVNDNVFAGSAKKTVEAAASAIRG